MLLLSTSSLTVDGVTVFPDHADKNQFWFLPAPVTIAKMANSDEPQFLLLEYAPDVASSGVKGVGFLDVTLCLKLQDDTRNAIMGQIRTHFPGADNPNLQPVPFDEGDVRIVALDLQGGGGTYNTSQGGFQAVESILGAVTPDLFGENDAVFGLTLSQDGASILKAAFEAGAAPVGCIYTFKFTGVRPALNVKITADLKRVYDSFSIGLTASYAWVSAGIDATFEKLRQDGAIKIEIVNLAGDQANEDREKQALAIFKDQILSEWFKPSLAPPSAKSGGGTTTSPPKKEGGSSQGGSSGSGSGSGSGQTGGGPSNPTIGGPPNPSGPVIGGPSPSQPTIGMNPPQPGVSPDPSPPGGGSPGGGPPPIGMPPPVMPAMAANAKADKSTADKIDKAAKTADGIVNAASKAASPYGVALRLQYVHQDELKTVTYEYNRMDAVQRTYAPQGFFGLLTDGLDKSKHFLQVDGSDRFFNRFSVDITPPKDFAAIGLQTAHLALDFGDTSHAKHGEFNFDPSHCAHTTWDVFQGRIASTEFTYAVDYSFDPGAGWTAAQDRYQLPPQKTDNRHVTLDPFSSLGFLTVTIAPGRIDPTVVDRIEIDMDYTGADRWHTAETFLVRPDSKPQTWKLRLSDNSQRAFSYAVRCILKDSTTFATGPVSSAASSIIANDVFDSGIDVVLVPGFDASHTKAGLVELNYRDPTSNYRFQKTAYLTPATSQPVQIHIPLIDPAANEFSYRITTIGVGGQNMKGDMVTTRDPVVVVGDRP